MNKSHHAIFVYPLVSVLHTLSQSERIYNPWRACKNSLWSYD